MTRLNIGIILGSTRQGRVSPQVGKWVKEIADARGDANYEIVDIASFYGSFEKCTGFSTGRMEK